MNPELPALGNTAEILADGLLTRETASRKENARLIVFLDVLNIALPAIYRIAATGNLQAKEACLTIHKLLSTDGKTRS